MNLSGDAASQAIEEIKDISLATAMSEDEGINNLEKTEALNPENENEYVSIENFDPNLISQSSVHYEQKGASIRDLRLVNAQGSQVNTLQMGKKYTYQYHVDFYEDAQNVAFGMVIKTVNGVDISGMTTTLKKQPPIKHVSKNQTAKLSYQFICNFMPGTYFINAGVVQEIDHERQFMHRILDGLIFQVNSETELEPVGLVNLQTKPPIIKFL